MGEGVEGTDGALARCLRDLREGGIVAVRREPDQSARGAAVVLQALDADARARGPDGLPEFDGAMAFAAAREVHEILIALAHLERSDAPQSDASQSDAPRSGAPRSDAAPAAARACEPASIHAVDLTFCHLPRLWELARRRHAGALVARIEALAAAWPMSGVGVAVAFERRALRAVLGHRALRVVFCDRVHARADATWREDPEVAAALASAEGGARSAPSDRHRPWPGGGADPAGDER